MDEVALENNKNRCAVITCLCLVNFTANSAYSSIAPFFPDEAANKGLPGEYFGFIFAGYSISMVVFAPVFAKLMT